MNFVKSGRSIVGGYHYAERYWNRESSKNPFWEILMSTPIEIIEKVE